MAEPSHMMDVAVVGNRSELRLYTDDPFGGPDDEVDLVSGTFGAQVVCASLDRPERQERDLQGGSVRALMVTTPQAGHVNPLRPLARALLDQGDEVFWATGEDPEGAISSVGAEFCRVGRTAPEWMAEFARRVRGRPGDGVPAGRSMHYMVPRLFGEIGAADMMRSARPPRTCAWHASSPKPSCSPTAQRSSTTGVQAR